MDAVIAAGESTGTLEGLPPATPAPDETGSCEARDGLFEGGVHDQSDDVERPLTRSVIFCKVKDECMLQGQGRLSLTRSITII